MTAQSSKPGAISKVLAFRGLERRPIEVGEAGDIVAIAGLTEATVADTIATWPLMRRSRRSPLIRRRCR